MITAHLTDEEIQLYVAEPGMLTDQLKIHMQECSNCQTRAANYQLLFNGINDSAKPHFNFDLSALILEQLPQPKSAFPWTVILVSVFSVLLISFSTLFFWSAIGFVIRSVPLLLIATALTVATVILIFQALEMFKNHERQMHTLLNLKTLQL